MDGEAVLVHPGRGEVKVLNRLGAEVWKRLNGVRTVRDVVEELILVYTVDQAVLEADVTRFIESLHTRELVTFADLAGRS